jgi:hypothetical protein
MKPISGMAKVETSPPVSLICHRDACLARHNIMPDSFGRLPFCLHLNMRFFL